MSPSCMSGIGYLTQLKAARDHMMHRYVHICIIPSGSAQGTDDVSCHMQCPAKSAALQDRDRMHTITQCSARGPLACKTGMRMPKLCKVYQTSKEPPDDERTP